MESIIKLRWLILAVMVLLITGTLGTLWAIDSTYNRPKPLMDYVPQEIGIYDTMYYELTEYDCRQCHGNSLAERHHGTAIVVAENRCIPCHEVTPGVGVSIIRDCTTSGCHSWYDLEDNGWHHNTDMSDTSQCIACHNPGLIDEITPLQDFEMYPPSVVTPTPFSCENCHWSQTGSTTGDPNAPGHPSTYDHSNAWNQFVGFYEYGKSIYGNSDTHHMSFLGNMASECYQCHSQNPANVSWDPGNQLLIRYCERCHDVDSLHRIGPHVEDTNGWEAVGFHVADNPDPADEDPVRYKTWSGSTSYLPEEYPGFTADKQCFGCHGDAVLPTQPLPPPSPPSIDNTTSAGVQPDHGCCGVIVTLRGENFGEEHEEGYSVQIATDPNEWMEMPIRSWTDTLIEFEIPCWTINAPGNYNLKVVTPTGESNTRVFTLEDCGYKLTLTPADGVCGTWITILTQSGGSFGNVQTEIFDDDYHGVHHVVDFVASQGIYTAISYQNWSSSSIQVKFSDFFQDGVDPITEGRNFVQDDGSGECPDEPTIARCNYIKPGKWAVYVKSIFFGDEDHSGNLSCGDTIFQVAISDPLYFELRNNPVIYAISPTRIQRDNLLNLFGLNFGPVQENAQLRIGSLAEAVNPLMGKGMLQTNIRRWSNTMIKAKVQGDAGWHGQFKYVWVEKSGVKSNYKRLRILAPL